MAHQLQEESEGLEARVEEEQRQQHIACKKGRRA
jgi:hypothetical protein